MPSMYPAGESDQWLRLPGTKIRLLFNRATMIEAFFPPFQHQATTQTQTITIFNLYLFSPSSSFPFLAPSQMKSQHEENEGLGNSDTSMCPSRPRLVSSPVQRGFTRHTHLDPNKPGQSGLDNALPSGLPIPSSNQSPLCNPALAPANTTEPRSIVAPVTFTCFYLPPMAPALRRTPCNHTHGMLSLRASANSTLFNGSINQFAKIYSPRLSIYPRRKVRSPHGRLRKTHARSSRRFCLLCVRHIIIRILFFSQFILPFTCVCIVQR
ncbi:hypothetical protein F5Y11DRAFT_224801 [Daldinia sp. FL1419]|nr:hypothetical protein F5Y11DRAFT_224801 [Daldinia sp. FL1419]